MQDCYIDIRELSRRLGLCPRTIRTLAADPVNPLPAYRPRGKLIFRWVEVEVWLSRFRVQPMSVDALVDELLAEAKGDEPDDGR
jgi:hypothetical protein